MADSMLREHAVRDIKHLAAALGRQSEAAGERFIDMALATLEAVAERPTMGRIVRCRHPNFRNARVCPVRGFRWALLVYLETSAGVEGIRILHGASELAAWLGERT